MSQLKRGDASALSESWYVDVVTRVVAAVHVSFARRAAGMLIESMAGKSAAMHAICHDATPFQFSEEQPAIDFFGQALREGKQTIMSLSEASNLFFLVLQINRIIIAINAINIFSWLQIFKKLQKKMNFFFTIDYIC